MQNAEVRSVQTPATLCKRCGTLCNRPERHAAAFTLSMLKTTAAAWRFHSVLDSITKRSLIKLFKLCNLG